MTAVAEIVVSADPSSWQLFGLPLDDDHCVVIGSVRLRVIEPVSDPSIAAWGLADAPVHLPSSIDGLITAAAESPVPAPGAVGPLGAISIDHLVVWTADLERTCAAVTAATDSPLKRVREVGSMRQGFHRLGEVILEVVQHPGVPAGPATFWGFVFTVADLESVAANHGPDVVTPPKDAVQPGRRIATVKNEAGLGVPVALMSR
jgi:hypothetical protein